MKKKLFFLVILLTLFLTSCGSDSDVRTYTVKEVPFVNLNPNYNVNTTKMNLYYFEDSVVPYMPIDEFVNDLDGLLNSKAYSFKYINFIGEYVISTKISGEELKAVVDYKADKLYTQYTQIFQNINESQTTDYSAYFKMDADTIDYDMKTVVLDFGKYNIDIILKDKRCYFPFSVLNTLFGAENYSNLYFNGDKIYMAYFVGADLESEKLKEIKNSSLTNTLATEELRKANYNDLLFTLDTFYGLKNYKNISSFDEYITNNSLKEKLLSTKPEVFEQAYKDLFLGLLNECHTGLITSSYYTGGNKISSIEGAKEDSNFLKMRNLSKKLKDSYDEVYTEQTYFEIVGNTAYIMPFEFVTGTNDQIFNADGSVKEDAYKYDTFRLFLYSMEKIKENPLVKNIVVDLSRNGGGNGAAMYRALGFLKQLVYASIKNEIMGLTLTYKISVDTNLDGKYNSSDSYPDYNWYVLTSGLTYSAANIFASICKDQKLATVIGQKSGGGMCSVVPVVLTDGTALQMSGSSALYVSIQNYKQSNQTVNYIEGGVEVDSLIDYEYFYDRTYINRLINGVQ